MNSRTQIIGPYQVYVRECRRMVAKYVMIQHDPAGTVCISASTLAYACFRMERNYVIDGESVGSAAAPFGIGRAKVR
jgi:hypothetical protein